MNEEGIWKLLGEVRLVMCRLLWERIMGTVCSYASIGKEQRVLGWEREGTL